MEGERRVRRIVMSGEFLISMMREGNIIERSVCTIGVPSDARFIGSFFDNMRFCAELIFEHDSFEPVEAGMPIPELLPVVYEKTSSKEANNES